MKIRALLSLCLLLFSAPLAAERLQFDHRLYPPLKEVLDAGDAAMLDFNNSNPVRLVDLIAVKGKSAKDWTEALEIVSLVRPRDAKDAKDWMALLQKQMQARCPASFEMIAEDENSVTFERRSSNCPAERADTGIYRLVTGKRSWFQLSVLVKGEIEPAARAQWLALLASARLD